MLGCGVGSSAIGITGWAGLTATLVPIVDGITGCLLADKATASGSTFAMDLGVVGDEAMAGGGSERLMPAALKGNAVSVGAGGAGKAESEGGGTGCGSATGKEGCEGRVSTGAWREVRADRTAGG